jgi:hypothetical protein
MLALTFLGSGGFLQPGTGAVHVKDCANQEQLEASSSFYIVLVNKEKIK